MGKLRLGKYTYTSRGIDKRVLELQKRMGYYSGYDSNCELFPVNYLLEYLHILKMVQYRRRKLRLLLKLLDEI